MCVCACVRACVRVCVLVSFVVCLCSLAKPDCQNRLLPKTAVLGNEVLSCAFCPDAGLDEGV